MTLFEELLQAEPKLTSDDFAYHKGGSICLQNDADGLGDYIKIWNYSLPIPEGFTLGKPSA
jgi:hypothetical protein